MSNLNIFTFFVAYLFIAISVIGYGLFFERISAKKNFGNDLGFTGLLGIFFLILYSYISNYFIAHTKIHNSILLLIGFILFIFLIKNLSDKKYLVILFFLICFSYISLIIFKTHDDFHYYHFPYSYYLTQFPALIGIGQFNHGFRTPSSIFYLNSLFYLPIVKFYTFYVSAVLFLVFSNLILLTKIIERFKNNNTNYTSYLCLLFLLFINIFFYRIQEHGTDRSAQILILILFLYLIEFINFEKGFEKNLVKLFVLMGLIISLKALYLQYLIISFVIIYILIKEKKTFLIIDTIKNKFFWFFLILVFNVIFVYLINTGCLIYPLSFTCFDNFSWSLGSAEAIKMNIHYENWSKGGMTPNSKVENPVEHIQNFNWVSNWIDIYFFTKVSDFILGMLLTIIILTAIFYKKNKIKFKINKNIFLIILIITTFLLEWFYNHPALRYGGYCLIVILVFFPFSIFLERYDNSINEKKKKFLILISIIFLVFFARNVSRINDEIIKYSYKPVTETNYKLGDLHFRLDKKFNKLIKNYQLCKNKKDNCNLDLEPQVKGFFKNRYVFIKSIK